MRVMVTGGAGYIGSVVTEALVARGHDVLVYDNLAKGHREAVDPEAAFIEADLLDREALRRALSDHGIEGVIHLAAESLVGESVIDPAKYYRANVTGGLELLGSLRAVAFYACGIRPDGSVIAVPRLRSGRSAARLRLSTTPSGVLMPQPWR